ncbi:MAG: Xaa-Pro peptidase family protein [Thermodesulfobacteriota bacterium]
MHAFPLEEIRSRIARLQSLMAHDDVDAALIVQRADLYYLSGTGQDAHLFVPREGNPLLMVRKSLERAIEDSPFAHITAIQNISDVRERIAEAFPGPFKTLGMELDVLPVNLFRKYEEVFPEAAIVDVSPAVRAVRMVKSPLELGLIRKAAEMNASMFSAAGELLEEGMTEMEFAGLLEAHYRKLGHQGYVRVRGFNQEVFYGHVMSGPSLAVPSCSVGPTGGPGPNPSFPQGAGPRRIGRHEPVSVDFVGVWQGYAVDQARTYFLGQPPEKFRRAHEKALEIQNRIVSAGIPGTRAEDLYDLAVEIAQEAGLREGFLGHPQPVAFVGHGVGLELDELPVLGRRSPHVLEPGMVVAIEPKFIFPGEGLAGIENTFVVTEHGMERLTLLDDSIRVVG